MGIRREPAERCITSRWTTTTLRKPAGAESSKPLQSRVVSERHDQLDWEYVTEPHERS